MRKLRVLFVFPSMNMGGAERVTLNLIKGLDASLFEASIYLFRLEGELLEEAKAIAPVYGTKNVKTKFAFWTLNKFLKKKEFDLIYSVTDGANIATLLVKKFFQKQLKVVTSSHSTFQKIDFKSSSQKFITKNLIQRLYPYADQSIVISKDALSHYIAAFPKLADKFKCIYNAAFDDNLYSKKEEALAYDWANNGKLNLFSCGRLVKPKGFPYLIKAVALLKEKGYDILLTIGGEGPDREMLEEQIAQEGLDDDVRLIGNLSNPFKFMGRCDIYVHSSLWDGLPTTLIEAMACGAAVVSTDCDSGPREIITDGHDGLLVRPPGNAQVLADGIETLIQDPSKRADLKTKAVKRAVRFSANVIVKEYEALFAQIAKKEA